MQPVEILHFHLFCGLGGGARGFNRGEARVGNMQARFRCIGGIDSSAAAIRDFDRLAGVPGSVVDLFSRDQYTAFHGHEPPPGWSEATPVALRRAAGGERPHILFLSAPCKGFSGLLSETRSLSAKYQALNGLALRGVWLALEAWGDDPPELILFENVPRIMNRGRHLLDQIEGLLQRYGYVTAETTHDCGELGGLAQSRKRFLLVARHREKVPSFLYEPEKRPLRGVGEVIGKLPVPGPEVLLPMHRMPALHWKTWVRLAFVEAGTDWRSLNKLRVADGVLADYGIALDYGFRGVLGVNQWDQPAGTIISESRPTNGNFSVADPRRFAPLHTDFHGLRVNGWDQTAGAITTQRSPGSSAQSVADPRIDGHHKSVQHGVRRWDEPAGVVTGKMFVGGGPNAVADPRIEGTRFNHVYRIVSWSAASPAVAGSGGPAGGLAVADPRPAAREDYKQTKYRVTSFEEPSGAVIGASTTGNGAYCVADPRTGYGPNSHRNKLAVVDWKGPCRTVTGGNQVQGGALSVADPRPEAFKDGKDVYHTGGHYGVVPYDAPSGAVTATGQHDNGRWSVADPRTAGGEVLPGANDRLVAVIRALDGTWHRPFTTLELAALQGLVDPEEQLELDGLSDSAWRERIGNAVPSDAAQAIAGVMGRALLMAWSGETFSLSIEPIWVRNIAVALSTSQAGR